MSTLTDSARSAVFRDGHITISLESGTQIRFPVMENARLARGAAKQLSRIEISPFGIHWPDLDEDLSFRGLLAGDYGQHQKVDQKVQPTGASRSVLSEIRTSSRAGSRRWPLR